MPIARGDAAVRKLIEILPYPEQQKILAWDKDLTKAREKRALAEPGKKRPRVATGRQRVSRVVCWASGDT